MFIYKSKSVSKYGNINIKLLLLLTEEQKLLLNKYFGHSRFVYNKCLDYNKKLYEKEKRSLSYTELTDLIPLWKKDEKTSFLSEVDATSLQQAIKDYCLSYEKFLKKQGGYPKYRSKRHKETFRIMNLKQNNENHNSVRLNGNKLKLGKFGWVITKPCQTIPNGSIQSVTVKRTKTGKVFATLTIRKEEPVKQLPITGKEAGFDLGMKNFAVSSDGVVIPVPEFISINNKKIAKLHRQVSRKQKGSKNREKAITKLGVAYEKDNNKRTDFLNKLSLSIVKEYDFIAMEHLDVQSILKDNKKELKRFLSKKKNKKVCELGWSAFMHMVEYKAKWYGKEFVQVNKYYPSSQTCSHCGFINKDIKDESIREWKCPYCNTEHNRDHNAAINILKEGKRIKNEKE